MLGRNEEQELLLYFTVSIIGIYCECTSFKTNYLIEKLEQTLSRVMFFMSFL
ncbi:unnamed protein product, partial [Vitis vinifera]|uniref:Uncharacterized protein n=1 Tax=Vitis vinifera TaxID=29760 RepID=D7TGG1_VITVI